MNADDVARWLKTHPEFFEQYADLLAQIYIPHPHGGRAIPISDRQLITLRDKNRALEEKLAELIHFGEENDAIGAKVHRLCAGLLPIVELDGALAAVYGSLREDFVIPHVAIRLWRGIGQRTEFTPVSAELRDFAAKLEHANCGPEQSFEATRWFGVAAEHVRSVAFIPLREGAATFGLLALAAEDPHRFYPEMGTLYLQRVAELTSAALIRFV